MTGRVLLFPGRLVSREEGEFAARQLLAVPAPERERRAKELRLEDPEILLAVCKLLRDGLERSPSEVRDDAEHLYRFLAEPRREIGIFDEREYFLGELALLAGTACRILARKSDASRWFDRSEANFRLTVNAIADWSRVSYQRLALRLEEREFDGLLEQLPSLAESFRKLDMLEDGVKCRFLEALALMETGEAGTAARAFESILEDSRRLASEKLIAIAYVNLVHVYGMLGETERALQCSQEALPILKSLDDRVNYAKVKAGIGALLRASGQLAASVEAYRDAQGTFAELQMHADVAANALIVADLSLQLGKEDVAIREIVAALPVIEEYSMVPEGMAALTLLRESIRQQKVNHQALRDLHGFFESSVS
jgi:tetratricopeptide (TPR) repeat protein